MWLFLDEKFEIFSREPEHCSVQLEVGEQVDIVRTVTLICASYSISTSNMHRVKMTTTAYDIIPYIICKYVRTVIITDVIITRHSNRAYFQ